MHLGFFRSRAAFCLGLIHPNYRDRSLLRTQTTLPYIRQPFQSVLEQKTHCIRSGSKCYLFHYFLLHLGYFPLSHTAASSQPRMIVDMSTNHLSSSSLFHSALTNSCLPALLQFCLMYLCLETPQRKFTVISTLSDPSGILPCTNKLLKLSVLYVLFLKQAGNHLNFSIMSGNGHCFLFLFSNSASACL